MTARAVVVQVLRLMSMAVTAAILLSLLLSRCSADATATTPLTPGAIALARQVGCFENEPPLFYDTEGNCFSADPTGLSAAQRAKIAVTPTSRTEGADGPAPPGPAAPGGAAPGPVRPGALARPVDPRSGKAKPPQALPVPAAPGAPAGGAAPPAGRTPTGQAPPGQGSSAPAKAPAAKAPTSPALGYIAEDGRTATVTKGPVVNGIQVWVHAPSRTLYADSCEVLKAISLQGQEFGPTSTAPGYGSICPQL